MHHLPSIKIPHLHHPFKKKTGHDHTRSLPDEILVKIFSHLCNNMRSWLIRTPCEELNFVCKRWHILSAHSSNFAEHKVYLVIRKLMQKPIEEIAICEMTKSILTTYGPLIREFRICPIGDAYSESSNKYRLILEKILAFDFGVLQSVELFKLGNLDDIDSDAISNLLKFTRKIEFYHTWLPMRHLIDPLLNNCYLKELSISHNILSKENMKALTLSLQKNTTIEILNLTDNKELDDFSLKIFSKWVKNCKKLKSLGLSSSKISEKGIAYLSEAIKNLPILESLSIGVDFNKEGALAFSKVMKEPTLRLHKVFLMGCFKPSCGMDILSNALRENTTVTFLYLDHNKFSDDDCKSLSEMMKVNRTLQKISLTLCSLTSCQGEMIANAMEKNSTIQTLNLFRNKIGKGSDKGMLAFSKALKFNHSLKCLSLEDNRVSESGMEILAEGLKHNTGLERLLLSSNLISSLALSEALIVNTTLKKLCLMDTLMNDIDAINIAVSLLHNRTLQVLLMSDNLVGDFGGQALAHAIKHNSEFKRLYISDNLLGKKSEKKLRKLAIKRSILIKLE